MTLKKQCLSILVETTDNATRMLDDRLAFMRGHWPSVSQVHLATYPSERGVYAKVSIHYSPKPHETTEQVRRWFRFRVNRWLDGYVVFEIGEVETHDAEVASGA